MTAFLHELRCEGPSVCVCTTLLRVRDTTERTFDSAYNMAVGVATPKLTGIMRAARLGATPLGRAARHSGVDE